MSKLSLKQEIKMKLKIKIFMIFSLISMVLAQGTLGASTGEGGSRIGGLVGGAFKWYGAPLAAYFGGKYAFYKGKEHVRARFIERIIKGSESTRQAGGLQTKITITNEN